MKTNLQRAVERAVREFLPQIEAEEQRENADRRKALAQELKTAEAAFSERRRSLEANVAQLDSELHALREKLETAERQRERASDELSDAVQRYAESRDKLWTDLASVADPRIAEFRRELRERLDSTPGLVCNWPRVSTWEDRAYQRSESNQSEVNQLAQALLRAIDLTDTWARTGLSGRDLDREIEAVLASLPKIKVRTDRPAL